MQALVHDLHDFESSGAGGGGEGISLQVTISGAVIQDAQVAGDAVGITIYDDQGGRVVSGKRIAPCNEEVSNQAAIMGNQRVEKKGETFELERERRACQDFTYVENRVPEEIEVPLRHSLVLHYGDLAEQVQYGPDTDRALRESAGSNTAKISVEGGDRGAMVMQAVKTRRDPERADDDNNRGRMTVVRQDGGNFRL